MDLGDQRKISATFKKKKKKLQELEITNEVHDTKNQSKTTITTCLAKEATI